jgi:protoheme IX farnesyltransferase
MSGFKDLAELFKLKIAVASTITGFASYVIRNGRIDKSAVVFFLSLLLLASGACALNQVQEKKRDAMMERTKNRPVASGKISQIFAGIISLFTIFSGIGILFGLYGFFPMLIGVIAVLWYNGIYTYLKRLTAWSPVVGAVVGLFPPVIGWTGAGGSIFEFPLWIILTVAFLYQVPHFLMLYLTYEEDYRRAGFPLLTSYFHEETLNKLIFIWALSIAVVFLLFFLAGIISSSLSAAGVIVMSAVFVYVMNRLSAGSITLRKAFFALNTYVFFCFLIPVLERI